MKEQLSTVRVVFNNGCICEFERTKKDYTEGWLTGDHKKHPSPLVVTNGWVTFYYKHGIGRNNQSKGLTPISVPITGLIITTK